VIVPSINSIAEPDFRRLAPAGVEFFATRLSLPNGNPEELRLMAGQASSAASLLADMAPDLVLFHCTAATMVADTSRAETITTDIARAARCTALATSQAVLDALRSLGARSVALIAPYMPDVVDGEAAFLETNGIAVPARVPLALSAPEFVGIEPARWRELAVAAAAESDADAIFLSCANVRTLDVVDELERELGRPVITSNQAAFWAALRATGVEDAIAGGGRLLQIANDARRQAAEGPQ
jgi:maleate isomerase